MKIEKIFVVVAILSFIMSLPTAYAISKRTSVINIQRKENSTLRIDINAKDKMIKSKEQLIKEQADKQEQLRKRNEELEKQLQAKIKRDQWVASLKFSVGGAPADKVGVALAHYLDKGLSKTATAYLVGNLITESKLDHTNRTGDGGKAWGLAQWHPNRRYDMPHDYVGQLDFVLIEMKRQTPLAYQIITNNPSPAEASRAMKIFEGYGIEGNRYALGRQILQRL